MLRKKLEQHKHKSIEQLIDEINASVRWCAINVFHKAGKGAFARAYDAALGRLYLLFDIKTSDRVKNRKKDERIVDVLTDDEIRKFHVATLDLCKTYEEVIDGRMKGA